MKNKIDSFVSAVAVLHNSSKNNITFLRTLENNLKESFTNFEIVLVDWNFAGNTIESLNAELNRIEHVRIITLSPNTSYEAAWLAGMENAIGDFVVTIHPEADPIESIYDLVSLSKNGSDIVLGEALNYRMSLLYWLANHLLRKFIEKIAGINIHKHTSHLRCFSRRSLNAIFYIGNNKRNLDIRIALIGYPKEIFKYSFINNKALRKKTILSELKRGVHFLVFSSLKPLKLISYLGITGSLMGLAFASYSILSKIFNNSIASGWSSLVLFISLLFTILFVMMFFLFEYLGRLFEEKGSEQLYSIISETHSNVVFRRRKTECVE